MSIWRRFLFLAVLAIAFGLTGCTSGSESATEPGEPGASIEDISGPFSEQDLAAARLAFDAGKERWESFEPFAYTLTVGWETVSELRIDVDADGTTISEIVVKGDPETSDIQGLPRSVDEVFTRVENMITMFEEDSSLIPDEGECGHHLNVSFDPDWGVPSRYDGLGPCDDGVGVYVTVTPLQDAE
jgi:hypothetical protein